MNTLSFPEILRRIASSPQVKEIIMAYREEQFPLEIAASEGAFSACLISLLYNLSGEGNFLAVVSTDTEAALLARDLESTGLKALVFPWWGSIPYREISSLSPVFGERTNVLDRKSVV